MDVLKPWSRKEHFNVVIHFKFNCFEEVFTKTKMELWLLYGLQDIKIFCIIRFSLKEFEITVKVLNKFSREDTYFQAEKYICILQYWQSINFFAFLKTCKLKKSESIDQPKRTPTRLMKKFPIAWWPNDRKLIAEIKGFQNTFLRMSKSKSVQGLSRAHVYGNPETWHNFWYKWFRKTTRNLV